MMKLSFRWYGAEDPVTLEYIRQIPGMRNIVSAVYDVPAGEVWSNESILALKRQIESAKLQFEVVESVPVHESIKLGAADRDHYIENYITNIQRLAAAGIRCICYNFMPVFDWTRTQLDKELADGSTALVYYGEQLQKMNPLTGELTLPGWDASYTKETLTKIFQQYESVTSERLWENLQYFLEAIVPIAEKSGVKMAIHPDDPPWPVFGLPRIITGQASLERLVKIVDSPANGLALCTGSLGANPNNNLPEIVAKFAAMGRIHFMHVRNVKHVADGFEESAHYSPCGSLDMVAILKAAYQNGFDGYIRPDHGRMIWGETGKPGYGLYDRALGAQYIMGIWETLTKGC